MLSLYADVGGEGGLTPWRKGGGVMDMPAREVLALRVVRSAWADCREKDRAKTKIKGR